MPANVTELLARIRSGERDALDELTPLVYSHLRQIAQGVLRSERPGHTLQATSLVHEAWIRLAHQQPADFHDRAHFFGIAARLMRQILVDHARALQAAKRSGIRVALDLEASPSEEPPALAILAVHEALERLAADHPRRAQFVEMRFFAGMTVDEIVECTGVPQATVYRDLRVAQAWLFRECACHGDA